MTTFSFWYPGDGILMWSVNIALQFTVVSGLSLLVAYWVNQGLADELFETEPPPANR